VIVINNMDVFEAIHGRRSIRKFKSDPVPAEILHRIIDAAHWAPSAGNLQSAEFIIIRDNNTKKSLVQAALGQDFIAQAPVVIVACTDTQRSAMKYGERGKILYSIQDAAASIQNLLLAAHDLGLGACWIGAFFEDKVSDILGIPAGVVPLAIIPIGYTDSKPVSPPRADLTEAVHFEKYGNKKIMTPAGVTTVESAGSKIPRSKKKKKKPTIVDVFRA
jgi:nitroreductase